MAVKNNALPLIEVVDLVQALAKQGGCDASEVGASREKGFVVRVRHGQLETLEHQLSQHLSLAVFFNQRSAAISISDFSAQAIQLAVEKACTICRYTEPDEFAGLAERAELAATIPDLDLYHPWAISAEAATQMALECDELARSLDERVVATEATEVDTYTSDYVYANSNDFCAQYKKTRHGVSCFTIAKQNGKSQSDYSYTTSRSATTLWPLEKVAREAVKRSVAKLGSRKISTRECPVIFDAATAKSLWGHLIGAISGGTQYRKNSFLQDQLNQLVFPDFVNVHQDPFIRGGLGSRAFDADGVATRQQHYIERGKLVNYVLSCYSARRLKMRTTGNSGGVFNLIIDPSQLSLDDMLHEMGTGLFVTELIGQGVNGLTGDYSRGAGGFWVENGKIQYPVQEITIASNLKDMFKNMRAIGNDIDYRGNTRTGSVLINNMTVAGN